MSLKDDLIAIRADYAATLAAEAAAQRVNGPKPSYSLDGESYQWDQWRDAMLARIEKLNRLIQSAGSPFSVRSRGRA